MRGLEPVSFYPAQGVCFRSSSWTSLAAMTSRDEAHPGARASRPHNTGKASPNSSTRVDRQRRRGSAWAGLMRFPPAGLPHRGETERHHGGACGRDARAPGWAPLPIALAPRGGTRRLAGPQTVSMRQSRPASWPFVVLRLRGSLFFSFVSGKRHPWLADRLLENSCRMERASTGGSSGVPMAS